MSEDLTPIPYAIPYENKARLRMSLHWKNSVAIKTKPGFKCNLFFVFYQIPNKKGYERYSKRDNTKSILSRPGSKMG